MLLLLLGGYLLGSVPFGLLIGKRYGIDIREVGSGNIGATNVWRACGPRAGVAAMALDILKGLLPALLALRLLPDQPWAHIGTGAMAVLGHSFSPWLGFRGGKGVATSLGVVVALVPVAAAVGFVVFITLVATTRYVSVGSMLGALALGLAVQLSPAPWPYKVLVWLGVLLIIVRHRGNIQRLLRGEENRFNLKGRAAVEETGER
ncbi:MAG: glycerol-3-phosphate 1-O-acyltransferase PlsY [Armatimonadetes bacterium]|nr:glycerol-3-phosphate 1-O-acyltransferase PlsY [Armatimonadota bacterium]